MNRVRAAGGRGLLGCTGLVFAVTALLVAGSPAKAQDKDEKQAQAEKILEKSTEALGGRAAFEKLYNRVSKGDARREVRGQVTRGTAVRYEAAPGRLYFMVDWGPGGKIESGTDGSVHWDLPSRGRPKIRTGESAIRAARERRFNPLLYWRELYERVELAGKEVVDGQTCDKVVLTPAVGQPEVLYISQKTGLPIRKDTVIRTGAGDLRFVDRMEDYRQIDGVFMSFRGTRTVSAPTGPERIYTWTWKTIEHNADIPAERFALPEAIRALVAKSAAKEEKTGGVKPQE